MSEQMNINSPNREHITRVLSTLKQRKQELQQQLTSLLNTYVDTEKDFVKHNNMLSFMEVNSLAARVKSLIGIPADIELITTPSIVKEVVVAPVKVDPTPAESPVRVENAIVKCESHQVQEFVSKITATKAEQPQHRKTYQEVITEALASFKQHVSFEVLMGRVGMIKNLRADEIVCNSQAYENVQARLHLMRKKGLVTSRREIGHSKYLTYKLVK